MKTSTIASCVFGASMLVIAPLAVAYTDPATSVTNSTINATQAVGRGTTHALGGAVKGTGEVILGVGKGVGDTVNAIGKGGAKVVNDTSNAMSGK